MGREIFYKTFFENTEDGFNIIVSEVIYDELGMISDCILTKVNSNFAKRLGLKEEDVIGKKSKEIFKDDMSIRFGNIDIVLKTGKAKRFEYYSKNTNLWYDILYIPILERLVGELYKEITVQKEYEKKLALHTEILSNIHDAVIVVDENNLITYCNKEFINLFGWSEKELLGKQKDFFLNSHMETKSKEIYLRLLQNFNNTPETETFVIKELAIFCKDGKKIIIDLNISKYKVLNDGYKGIIIAIQDVGKRVEHSNKLQQSEKNAQLLIEKLQKADENRNEFYNAFSHEIRNPMAAAMMSLSIINSSNSNIVQLVKAKDILKRQLGHLSLLIDDLLDVTRIRTNKVNLNKEVLEINELIKNSIIDHKESFSKKGIELIFKASPTPLYIVADKVRIIQVLDNLLNNAVKFTNKGDTTTIKVSKDEKNSEAIIIVIDTGIGIEPKILPFLFEPFRQVDNSIDRSNSGLGLGLAIVKGMLKLHGGSVEASSEGIGKGTCFTIRLPLITKKEEEINNFSKEENKPFKSLNILVIDDNKDLTEMICELINLMGHKTESAFNGIEGLTKAKIFDPDVIICDIGLPIMNGYEVAKNIRKDNDLKKIYLIALSGYAQKEDVERSIKSGFNIHLAKPLSFETLEATLNEILAF